MINRPSLANIPDTSCLGNKKFIDIGCHGNTGDSISKQHFLEMGKTPVLEFP